MTRIRRVVWTALMTFSITILAFCVLCLFYVDNHQSLTTLRVDIAIYLLAIWQGWRKRRNWL